MTFRIWVALEYLQYLDNHEPQRFDFCIECTPTDSTYQFYHHQVKIMIIYEGTNNLVSGAFLKCFSICLYRLFPSSNFLVLYRILNSFFGVHVLERPAACES